ncbi:MAG: hypothetical protein ABI688_00875 [Bacteroidota bacterium]
MKEKDNILKELSELNSVLATTTLQDTYTVPAGYFDGLAAAILSRIKALEAVNTADELSHLSPALSNLSKQMPYAVPQGYFEELAGKAIKLTAVTNDFQTSKEELAGLSPLLSGLKKEMPFAVPQGYFESLAGKIAIEENKPAAKVISMTGRKWLRYAAAAVVTGILVMSGFMFLGRGEKEPGGKALAKFTRDIKKMDDTQKDKLIDFIDAGMNGNETAQVKTGPKTDEIKTLLQGVSDEELKDFQEQTEDVQDILMTN